MRVIRFLALYTALMLGANGALAAGVDLSALATGDMKKLTIHSAPKPAAQADFVTVEGGSGNLANYRGKVVLLNFWATWCAPCRKEMPMLADLQTQLGGDDFAVITLATGRNSVTGIAKFMDEIGAANLPQHRDPKSAIARQMGVLGLPTTVILNRDGQEIARLLGEADWSTPSAKAILQAVIAQ